MLPLIDRKFRTIEEGFGYIESFTNLERTNRVPIRSYRLDRMRTLLELFGSPHSSVRTIHIAGTKGKGSTGIYLSSILSEAGCRTGFYASPHVSNYTERITLAGTPFEEALYLEMINAIATNLSDLRADLLPARSKPTTFELLTLLGFLVFRETQCDWAVIETGIGGRLDATNVISPDMCILTPVEKEHTELLGATLPRIAGEKAGIIKRSTPVFSGYQHPDVRRVFEQTAATMDAPLRFLSDEIQPIESRILPNGSEVGFRWANGLTETFELSMPGEVQAENAALAVLAIRTLLARNQTENLTVKAVERGLRRARLPGRMELFTLSSPERKLVPSNTASKLSTTVDKPARIIIDAAHTPVSVSRLLDSFRRMFPGEAVLIFGSVLGKNPQAMAEVLAGYFKHIFISTPGNFKKSDPEGVWRHFAERNPLARLVRDPREALRRALSASEMSVPILVTGSFYMVAEIRKILLDWNAAGPASLNFEHLR